MFPVTLMARRHDIGVAGKHQMSAVSGFTRIEVFDVRRAFFSEDGALNGKAHWLKHRFECRKRAAFSGRYGRTADESGEVIGGIGRKAHDVKASF